MNYLKIYNSLIQRAVAREKTGYVEHHHIIPKCLGGTDDTSNLVYLTAEEHYLAHQLLIKIYPTEHKLVFAARMMTVGGKKHIRSNKAYGWIRRKVAKAHSESQKGKSYGYKFVKGQVSPNKGKVFGAYSEERKQKLRKPKSITVNMQGPKSKKHKEAMSKAKIKRSYKLIDLNGNETIFQTVNEASKFSKLSIAALIKLAGNRYHNDTCKGWKCVAIPL